MNDATGPMHSFHSLPDCPAVSRCDTHQGGKWTDKKKQGGSTWEKLQSVYPPGSVQTPYKSMAKDSQLQFGLVSEMIKQGL